MGLLALVPIGNIDDLHMRPEAICTIGYEGGTIDAFISVLKRGRVELVLDIANQTGASPPVVDLAAYRPD